MRKRYWLVHPHGGWQMIDPEQFDLDQVAEQARRIGGRLIVEDGASENASDLAAGVESPPLTVFQEEEEGEDMDAGVDDLDGTEESDESPYDEPGSEIEVMEEHPFAERTATLGTTFEPPVVALGHMFRMRLKRIYVCKIPYQLEMNCRPTARVLGGYYKSRSLVRIYTHDQATGRRTIEELFDTFLHEIAHHVEYTEPESFRARKCGRVRGCMHSRLFWRILGELKGRWADLQEREGAWAGEG